MLSAQYQIDFPNFSARKEKRQSNKLDEADKRFHRWYRFVLSFPPHLIRAYLREFKINHRHTVLDPFCGTGTTLVECKLQGIRCIGIEAAPFAHFASDVKTDWRTDPDLLDSYAEKIADDVLNELKAQGIDDDTDFAQEAQDLHLRSLEENTQKLLIKNSVSPIPLHKLLILRDYINKQSHEPYYRHALLALANALVFSISNLHFGPEIGVRKIKSDTPAVSAWLSEIKKIVNDLKAVKKRKFPDCDVLLGDSREISQIIPPCSVDAVITSPPYPNEKDYTRIARLESVILGFMKDKNDLRSFKKSLIRSNTRGVYKGDDDHLWIADNERINRIAQDIEQRRIELGKNSGFEKLYSTVTRLYFGGITRHLAELRTVLKPGAKLAYVVGDQASYLRVMIRTGNILADIAKSLGYELITTDLFRTRRATATKSELREEVLTFKWSR